MAHPQPALIKSIFDQYPHLHLTLPKPILAYLEEGLNEDCTTEKSKLLWKISSSDEYLIRHWEYFFVIKGLLFQAQYQAMDVFVSKHGDNTTSASAASTRLSKLVESYEALLSYLRSTCDLDMLIKSQESTETRPRIVRLATALELSAAELRAFLFVLVGYIGSLFPALDSSSVGIVSVLTNYCDLSSGEMLRFLAPNRTHVKQGLLEVDSVYASAISTSIVKMPREVAAALIGSPLSADEFLKIDKTALSAVLLEEEEFRAHHGVASQEAEAEANGDAKGDGKPNDDVDGELDDLEQELEATLDDENFDVFEFMAAHNSKKQASSVLADATASSQQQLYPYTSDIEYLGDRFEWLACRIRMRQREADLLDEELQESHRGIRERSSESMLRELYAKERMHRSKCERRLKATLASTDFVPRLEYLAYLRKLSEFEKLVLLLLVAGVISHEVYISVSSSYDMRRGSQSFVVGFLLFILCDSLEERMLSRPCFYKRASLVRDSLIRISDRSSYTDLMECQVDVDRRVTDFIVGLYNEAARLVDAANLYKPSVHLEQVILPEEYKKLVVYTVTTFDYFYKARKKYHLDETISYGNGIVILLHGQPGTGKTMLANAIANYLDKNLLLINFSRVEKTADLLRSIFLESKISNALLFFDECESFFSRREASNDVTALLTEIERHDGLVMLATNRPEDLDAAMNRRITLSIPFQSPDHVCRKKIWMSLIPAEIMTASDTPKIDFDKLAMQYELTGGLIKNAVLSALSLAVARDPENPRIRYDDLERGAYLYLRASLQDSELGDRTIIPCSSIGDLVVDEKLRLKIDEIIRFEKSRKVLTTRWGFPERGKHAGYAVLMLGPSGTGKLLAAEVIAMELGLNLKIVDMVEISSRTLYAQKNLHSLFREKSNTGCLLLFEIPGDALPKLSRQADVLYLLLYCIESFAGICILKITQQDGVVIDSSIRRRFKHVLEFSKPDARLREYLWRKLIPSKLPLATGVDFKRLAIDYDEFSGGNISNVIYRAASKAALSTEYVVTQYMLKESSEDECLQALGKGTGASQGSGMWS